MKKINFDDLYVSASSGNKESYRKLYDWFQNLGNSIASGFLMQKGIYAFNKEDLSLYIAEMYLIALRSFEPGKIPFHRYCEFLLKRHMKRMLDCFIADGGTKTLSLDALDEDGIAFIDKIESDDYEAMLIGIEKDEEKQVIASKSLNSFRMNKRLERIAKMKEAGIPRREICRRLNISQGQYRYMMNCLHNVLTRTIEMK